MKTTTSLILSIIFAALTLCLNSCSIQDVSVGTPKDVKVNNLSLNGISIEGKIPIENPNNFGFNLSKINIEVYVNDINIGRINKREKIHIKPHSKNSYPLKYDATFKDIVKDPITLTNAFTKGSVTIKLSGYVTASKFLLSKKIKVEHKENISKFKFF